MKLLLFRIVKFTTKFHISEKANLVTKAFSQIIGIIAGVCFAIEA